MNSFLSILCELAEFSELLDNLKSNISPLSVTGVSESVRAHLISCVCQKLEKGALVLAHSDSAATEIYEDLKFFAGENNTAFFPASELMFYDAEAKSRDILSKRLDVLKRIITNKRLITVTTLEALLSITVPLSVWTDFAIKLSVGDEIEIDTLSQKLITLGYRREAMVEGKGQFSVRGGIVDVFAPTHKNPVRIEFFDCMVDSIRIFDTETQRTVEMADCFEASPANELLLTQDTTEKLCKTLKDKLSSQTDERSSRLNSVLTRDIERLNEGIYFPSLDKYIPYIYKSNKDIPTILDYIDNSLIFIEEGFRISEKATILEKTQAEDNLSLFERGIICDANALYSLSYKNAVKKMSESSVICINALSHSAPEFKAKRIHSFSARSLGGFRQKPELLYETLDYYRQNMYRTIILAGSVERAKNLHQRLEQEGFKCSYQKELEKLPPARSIVVCSGYISKSFEYPLIKLAIIGDKEIFGRAKKKRKRELYRGKKGSQISNFNSLKPGDYVVHANHGIGLYSGIEQLNVDGVLKDYLKIIYKNSDTLYVPTDQLNMVYHYDKKEGAKVKINSLSGTDWAKTRQKVKEAATDMAKQLLALYSQRASIKGIAFSPDTEWQKTFESSFAYEETEDQLRSIDEVKSDMEKPYPMDRLLCGDVGYGKTEVALRAAFKAVMSGYQVAYLVPTTILASQHFNTFKQRMMDFPVNIEMLSRFRTPTAQKKILKALKTGEVDIVIGTHKLLSSSVDFKKLGLLIIDEEQRFGVAHKEKIKELKQNIDVLTLSATPIPRTLHMSLSGIRDMSIINQPPAERYPAQTYVIEYDEFIVKEAIEKELSRGGQVYYLFNRVDGIYKTANRIAELIPSARVAVAHGKMSETELENIMMEVSEGEIDVLVCTTIIETGLDIANVNTIIIENADRLGLSQLYQLRGRVGRSNRLAHAYLTFRRNKMLTEDAEKRLLAMKEFTEFGSGFKIAMRDLEIRGTGNLIGAQQHGHMDSVGYEMYCSLLQEAVLEQKGIEKERVTETSIDLPVCAYIPEGYIKDHGERIGAYKKIAAIETKDSLFDVFDELEDRFGTVPDSVLNLMDIALIKNYASHFGILELMGNHEQVIMRFDPQNIPDMQPIIDIIQERPKQLFMTNPKNPVLHLKLKKPQKSEEKVYLKTLMDLFEELTPQKCE